MLALLICAGCSLYSDVSFGPLIVTPTQIERGSDIRSAVQRSDFLRAIEFRSKLEQHEHASASELTDLGAAELASGRYAAARKHLREAVKLDPFRTTLAQAEWHLAEAEYMVNDFAASLHWARRAKQHGLNLREWHLEYLEALEGIEVYSSQGNGDSGLVRMKMAEPQVPRLVIRVNGTDSEGIIDSGAVLSIISRSLAAHVRLTRLPVSVGTFYGLLGEPIDVSFGLLESLQIGNVTLRNVPVAVMPDEKMKFVASGGKPFDIHFLLGANLLKEFRLELDFPHQTARFQRLTAGDHHPDADQNLFIENFRPVVRATVNRHGWFIFLLDTGSEVTFVNERRLNALPISFYTPKLHTALLQGLGGSEKRGAKLENIQLGVDRWAGTFKNLPMYEAGDREQACGIIGENFIRRFRMVLDFGKMRMDLLPQ